VDINDESVEIAKLSLWLHTARKDRKLSDLNNNIKCGNSLINDPKVAGDKAFDWHKEFPDIMQAGGFDVVIGNPPYVRADTDVPEFIRQRKGIEQSGDYLTLYEKWDLMVPFYERSIKLLKTNGLHGFIASNAICTSKYAFKLQKWILETKSLISLDYFDDIEVFKGVGVVPIISIIKNSNTNFEVTKHIHNKEFENVITFKSQYKLEDDDKEIKIFKKDYTNNKLHIDSTPLGDICYISVGMVINADEKKSKGEFTKDDLISLTKDIVHSKSFIEGKDLDFYRLKQIKYFEWDTDRVPSKLRRPTFPELYVGEKIMRGALSGAILDNTGIVCNHGVMIFKRYIDFKNVNSKSISSSITKSNSKTRKELESISENYNLSYILAIINSKYALYALNNSRRHRLKNYFYPDDFRDLPIPNLSYSNQESYAHKADRMLDLNKQLQEKKNKFHSRIKSNFAIEKISTKLESFHEHDFKTFVAELKKQKVSPTLKQQDEWEEYFNSYKKEINDLQAEIRKTDAEIDQMVYKLYELTEEEIRIVEGSVK
jgi:hypothetical protein